MPGARKQIQGDSGGASVGAGRAEAWFLEELWRASQAEEDLGSHQTAGAPHVDELE